MVVFVLNTLLGVVRFALSRSFVRICFLGIIGIASWSVFAQDDAVFVTPDILKHNVAFWKKIYTEIPLTEGYLHDTGYPMVIYARISVGGRYGKSLAEFVRPDKEQVIASLRIIDSLPQTSWGVREIEIVRLFDTYASRNALAGAIDRIRFQQGQRDRFYQGLCRSGAYLDTIRSVLASHGVPLRLAYLPHVESSFNTEAYSKVGAAGLWQFMRSTGKLYMRVDYNVDERRDPIASTHAAAKLLSHNYSQLQSWPLAITAYNHGLNGMMRAVANTGSRDIGIIIERHESPSFKFASKNFYSCFLAASEIAANPEKYFATVSYAPKAVYKDLVLSQPLRPAAIASQLGITTDMLAKMNLSYRPIVFSKQMVLPTGTVLHIPANITVARADSALAKIPDSLKVVPVKEKSGYYTVRPQDNLIAIAKRLGISVADLASFNNITRANHIFAGQVLRIPAVNQLAAVAAKNDTVTAVVNKPVPVPIVAVAPVPSAITGQPAKKTDVQKSAVAAEILPDSLKEVVLAVADTVPTDLKNADTAIVLLFDADVYDLDMQDNGGVSIIRVSVDETMGHYADWSGISMSRIRQINGLRNSAAIQIGRMIRLPFTNEEKKEAFKQNRLEYHMAIEEDFYGQYTVVDIRSHVVEKGESVWSICGNGEGDDIPLWLLTKYNRQVPFENLQPGMTISMPVTVERSTLDARGSSMSGGRYPSYSAPLRVPHRSVRPSP
jgi:membrane-bound lytic murein transglycosylase D